MSRYQRRLDTDTGYADGHLYVPILATNITGAGAVISNAVIAGTSGISLPTSATAYVINVPIGPALYRYGVQDDLQAQFGGGGLGGTPFGAQGLNVNAAQTLIGTSVAASNAPVVLAVTAPQSTVGFVVGAIVQIDVGAAAEFQTITAINAGVSITVGALSKAHTATFQVFQNPFTTPASVSGAPPFTGLSQLTPVTAPRPKGIQIKAIYPVYQIGAVNATLNTISLQKAQFTNNQAPVVSNIIASGANGMQTAFQAATLAYVTPIVVAAPAFQITKFTEIFSVWSLTTGTGGTATVFGMFLDVTYNYN
jgi:hypothetical protein